MARESTLERVLGAGAGYARMNAAVLGDLARFLDPRADGDAPADPFDAWDPDYIRKTLPTLRAFADLYHRAEVRGLTSIPREGPVLLVGNHSGGTLISDTFVFAQAFYDHFGPLRRFHQLAHDLVFTILRNPQLVRGDVHADDCPTGRADGVGVLASAAAEIQAQTTPRP
jgi:hypothetical protein